MLNRLATLNDIHSHYLVTLEHRKLKHKYRSPGGVISLRSDLVPSSDFLLKLTDWMSHNNGFLFMDEMYLQKLGVPMGSCFPPNYACLFLSFWEKEHVLNPVNPFHRCITWYGRYIDDILLIFDGNENQLLDFHKYMNSINKNIRLSIDYSQHSNNFLDLTIFKGSDGQLHTTLFKKSTSHNTILRADSFHPRHLNGNIPYGQFQRLRRICDQETDFEEQAQIMSNRFLD